MFTSSLFKNISSVKGIIGELTNETLAFSSDTRSIQNGESFFAIKGEFFDGHEYIEAVLEKVKIPLVVLTFSENNKVRCEELRKIYPKTTFVLGTTSIDLLQDLSKERLKQWRSLSEENKVIGITGSNGKTTTKEILIQFIEKIRPGKVQATIGNLNNHLGVPRTILNLVDETEILIVEMGTNHPGEIQDLCDIAEPDWGILTSIGASHLEFFGSEQSVFAEKSALFNSVSKRAVGKTIVPFSDEFLSKLSEDEFCVAHKDWSYVNETLKINDKEFSPKLEGLHNITNLMTAFTLVNLIWPNHEEGLSRTIESIELPSNNRSEWITCGESEIFLDAYNANPSSMKASLNYFSEKTKSSKHPLYILGDMNELGEKADDYHREIGSLLKKLGAKSPVFIGRYAGSYAQGFGESCTALDSVSAYTSEWRKAKDSHNFILIKGSRSLQLESLIDIR